MKAGEAHIEQLIGLEVLVEIHGQKVLGKGAGAAERGDCFRRVERDGGEVAADKAAPVSDRFFCGNGAERGHSLFAGGWRNWRHSVEGPSRCAWPGRKGKRSEEHT